MNIKDLGFSTGACAAAAAKAAAIVSCGISIPTHINIPFPDGFYRSLPIAWAHAINNGGEAAVIKSAGSDTTDISNGATIIATVTKSQYWTFEAGDGVGTVTKLGLQIPVGEPAINQGPRTMIRAALTEIGWNGAKVKISIPNGTKLALRTLNSRLGITDGLSILGTTGRVKPFDIEAIRTTIQYAMNVIRIDGHHFIAMTPGNLGRRALHAYNRELPIVEVSNEWGYALDRAVKNEFQAILIAGHPGKLVKLAENQFDTHSARSSSCLPRVTATAKKVVGCNIVGIPTVEGIFQILAKDKRKIVANLLAKDIAHAIKQRTNLPCAVVLTTMDSEIYGNYMTGTPWA